MHGYYMDARGHIIATIWPSGLNPIQGGRKAFA